MLRLAQVVTPTGLEPAFDLGIYYPIFIYLALVIAFAAGSIIASYIVGPSKRTAVKLMPYESGMDPIGDARQQYDVKFYLIAILFLVFDVELLFLYPWATVAYSDAADASWKACVKRKSPRSKLASAPHSALTVATNVPLSSIASRLTVLKPESVNVTV